MKDICFSIHPSKLDYLKVATVDGEINGVSCTRYGVIAVSSYGKNIGVGFFDKLDEAVQCIEELEVSILEGSWIRCHYLEECFKLINKDKK